MSIFLAGGGCILPGAGGLGIATGGACPDTAGCIFGSYVGRGVLIQPEAVAAAIAAAAAEALAGLLPAAPYRYCWKARSAASGSARAFPATPAASPSVPGTGPPRRRCCSMGAGNPRKPDVALLSDSTCTSCVDRTGKPTVGALDNVGRWVL